VGRFCLPGSGSGSIDLIESGYETLSLGDHHHDDHLLHGESDLNGGDGEEEEGEAMEGNDDIVNGDNHDATTPASEDKQRAGGGVKRKAGEAEVSEEKEGGVSSVRKSSRIRILLDMRKEKEEAMLQGEPDLLFKLCWYLL
jgi:hypothetical protein